MVRGRGRSFEWGFIRPAPWAPSWVAVTAVALGLGAAPSFSLAGSDDRPARIVAASPGVAEIIASLGLAEQVVGVGAGTTEPAAYRALPNVGYERALSLEGLLSLSPSLVLTTDEAGPPEALAGLERFGVPVATVPSARTVEGLRQRVTETARRLGCVDKGANLLDTLERDLTAAEAEAKASEHRPSVLFVYARGGGTLLVSGEHTGASEMIRLSGARNAMSGFEGYRPLTAEALVTAAPDCVLLTNSGIESLGGESGLWALPGLAQTPAGRARRSFAMDDALLLGFGPRLPEALRRLREAWRDPDHPGATTALGEKRP